ncbi:hypothetical protein [Streptomyces exfoliatus]|uniref:hypothetical protein n=1 Tax=Streptomyces exfoliatus TaxID=1905 RepID=UPI0037B915EE
MRGLYPFPTHGTRHFLRSVPPWSGSDPDDVPFIVYGGPPYQVYTAGYAALL